MLGKQVRMAWFGMRNGPPTGSLELRKALGGPVLIGFPRISRVEATIWMSNVLPWIGLGVTIALYLSAVLFPPDCFIEPISESMVS